MYCKTTINFGIIVVAIFYFYLNAYRLLTDSYDTTKNSVRYKNSKTNQQQQIRSVTENKNTLKKITKNYNFMHMFVQMRIHAYIHICMYINICIHTYIHMYMYMHSAKQNI